MSKAVILNHITCGTCQKQVRSAPLTLSGKKKFSAKFHERELRITSKHLWQCQKCVLVIPSYFVPHLLQFWQQASEAHFWQQALEAHFWHVRSALLTRTTKKYFASIAPLTIDGIMWFRITANVTFLVYTVKDSRIWTFNSWHKRLLLYQCTMHSSLP